MVPRLVLGLVAAASSLWWCALVIDVSDAVSQVIVAVRLSRDAGRPAAGAPAETLLAAVHDGQHRAWPCFMALLYLIYGFFVLYVLVQMILRLALIDILLCAGARSPWGCGYCPTRRDGAGTG